MVRFAIIVSRLEHSMLMDPRFPRWRSAFWFLSGLAIPPLIGLVFFIPSRPIALKSADKRVDWLGAVLFTTGFILLFYPISQARATEHGWRTQCKWWLQRVAMTAGKNLSDID